LSIRFYRFYWGAPNYPYSYNQGFYYGAPYGYYKGSSYDMGYADGFDAGRFDRLQGNIYDPRHYERLNDPEYFRGFVAGYEDGWRGQTAMLNGPCNSATGMPLSSEPRA
jgi:hypothetical protein